MLSYDTKFKLALLEELDIAPSYEINLKISFSYISNKVVYMNPEAEIINKIEKLIKTKSYWNKVQEEYACDKIILYVTEGFIAHLLNKNKKYIFTQNVYSSIKKQLFLPAMLLFDISGHSPDYIINPEIGIRINTKYPYNDNIISYYNLKIIDTDKDDIKFVKIEDENQVYNLLLIENKFIGDII